MRVPQTVSSLAECPLQHLPRWGLHSLALPRPAPSVKPCIAVGNAPSQVPLCGSAASGSTVTLAWPGFSQPRSLIFQVTLFSLSYIIMFPSLPSSGFSFWVSLACP